MVLKRTQLIAYVDQRALQMGSNVFMIGFKCDFGYEPLVLVSMLGLQQAEYVRAYASKYLVRHRLYTKKILDTYTRSKSLNNTFLTNLFWVES